MDQVVLAVDQVVLNQVVLTVDLVVLAPEQVVSAVNLVVLTLEQVVLEVDQAVSAVDLVVLLLNLAVHAEEQQASGQNHLHPVVLSGYQVVVLDGPTASEVNRASALDPEVMIFVAECSSMLPLVSEAKDRLVSAVALMALAQHSIV